MSDHPASIGGKDRAARGAASHARGLEAEARACEALVASGFTILGRRLRTASGEIDVAAATDVLLVFAEVKCRRDFGGAAAALGPRQRARLQQAAEILLAAHPDWARPDMRFDVLILDRTGRVRRIPDAFRQEEVGQSQPDWHGCR